MMRMIKTFLSRIKNLRENIVILTQKKEVNTFMLISTEIANDPDRFLISNDHQSLFDFIYSIDFDGKGREQV